MAYNIFIRKSDSYSSLVANVLTYEQALNALEHLVDSFKDVYKREQFFIQETPFYTSG